MIRRDKIPTHVAPVDRVLTVASTDAAAHGGRVLVPRATDAIRRLYTEYAWLGVLNAAAVTFAPVYALRWGAEPALVGLLVAAPAVTGLLVSLPAARLLAAYANPWTLMLRARVAARLPYALVVLLPLLPFGRQADTPRDAVLLAAMVALGVHPVLTVVSGGALPLLLAASLVGGVGSGGLQLGLFEGLLQHTPAEGRPGYIATSNTLTYLALMLGPVLGTLLTGLAGTGPLLCVAAGIRLAAPGIQAFSQRRAAA